MKLHTLLIVAIVLYTAVFSLAIKYSPPPELITTEVSEVRKYLKECTNKKGTALVYQDLDGYHISCDLR